MKRLLTSVHPASCLRQDEAQYRYSDLEIRKVRRTLTRVRETQSKTSFSKFSVLINQFTLLSKMYLAYKKYKTLN